MKKRIFVCIYACILACFIAFSSAGCGCFSNKGDFEFVGDCHLWVESAGEGKFTCGVNGTIKNKTSKSFELVTIEFSIYDAQGNDLGTAIATFNNIEGEKSWEFLAVLVALPTTEPTTFKLKDIKSIEKI